MFETLLALLLREDLEPTIRVPIVDNLFGFVSNLGHIELALKWLEKGAITKENGEEVFKLAQKHKYSIVKVVFEEPSYPVSFKQELLDKTIGEDKSDIAVNVRETCRALIPDAESKAKIW